jgi:hypothetical protein
MIFIAHTISTLQSTFKMGRLVAYGIPAQNLPALYREPKSALAACPLPSILLGVFGHLAPSMYPGSTSNRYMKHCISMFHVTQTAALLVPGRSHHRQHAGRFPPLRTDDHQLWRASPCRLVLRRAVAADLLSGVVVLCCAARVWKRY